MRRDIRYDTGVGMKRLHNLPISVKVGVILLTVMLGYTAIDQAVDRISITRAMEFYENEQGIRDLARCEQAIQRELHHLVIFTGDWAAWNDTYDFVQTRDEGYIASNFVVETFQDNGINLICVFDRQGELVWGEAHDLSARERLDVDVLIAFPRTLHAESEDPPEPLAGVVLTEMGPMLVVCHPILTSDTRGPARGMMAMGRLLTPEMLCELRQQTRVDFQIRLLAAPSTDDLQTLSRIQRTSAPVIDVSNKESLHAYCMMQDIFGRPALLLDAQIPRTVTIEARRIIQSALISTLGAGILFLLVLLLALRHTVIAPIVRLTRDVVRINQADALSERLGTERADEIGQLAIEFDRLLEKVEVNTRRHIEAAEALRDSEAHLRAIIQAARDAVFTLDAHGSIKSSNPAAQAMFGRVHDDLVGCSADEIIAGPRGVAGGIETIASTARSLPDGFRGEVTGVRQDQSTFPAYIMVKDYPAESGTLYVMFVADLTEITSMHERVMRNRHLATIGEMGASIAHEIRNPLTGISSALQVLRKNAPADSEVQSIFDEVLQQVKRVERTVRSLLTFAKPWRPERRWCSVKSMLARSWEEVGQRRQRDGFLLTMDVSEKLEAWVDSDLVQQVFSNLMLNAVQAMPEGGEIHARAWQEKREIRIGIADDGPGMEHEVLANAMNPFFSTRLTGTGLGLAICQRIVDAHGGTIHIDSVHGVGTKVVVAFPLEQADVKMHTGG